MAFRALLDNCLAVVPLQHRTMLCVTLETRRRKKGSAENGEEGGWWWWWGGVEWGEHGRKVEEVGVDSEEKEAGDGFVVAVVFLFLR